MSDSISTLGASPRLAPVRRLEQETERLQTSSVDEAQLQQLNAYYTQVLGEVQELRQPNLPALPPVVDEFQELLEKGDLTFLSDLDDEEACELVADFLDRQAKRLKDTQGPEREKLHHSVRQAFRFIVERNARPGMGRAGFSWEITQIAQEAVQDQGPHPSPGMLERGLTRYQNARSTGSADAHANLAAEVADPELNMLQVYYKVIGLPNRPPPSLTPEQKAAVAEALLKRMAAPEFQLGDAGMARAVLKCLGRDPGAGRWAEMLAESVQQRLDNPPAGEQLYDYTRLGMEHLAEALKEAEGPAREKLLVAIRRLYAQLHYNDRGALLRETGGKDHHGHFIPEDVRQGRNLSPDKVQVEFDRMGADDAGPDDFAAALSSLERQGVASEARVGHSMEALKTSRYRDTARFLDPLLDEPDPDGKVAQAIAAAAFGGDSGEVYSGLRGDTVELPNSLNLLEHLAARGREPGVARQAALALLARIISNLDMRKLAPGARDRLLALVQTLPPGPETLMAGLRLMGEARPSQAEALRPVIEASRTQVLQDVRELAGQPEARPELDAALERLGFAYSTARREGRTAEADEIRKVLNRAVAEAADLPLDGEYIPDYPESFYLWSRYDHHRQGSYLRDFVGALGKLSPERRRQLNERLGDLPFSEWKEAPLGYAPDSLAYSRRDIREQNDFAHDVRSLRLDIKEAERTGQSERANLLRQRLEERVDRHKQSQDANSGLTGRLQAAHHLGDSFDHLTSWAERRNLSAREFDAILMKSAALPPAVAQKLMQLATADGGLEPARLLTMLEVLPALPPETVEQVLAQADSHQALAQSMANLCLRRLRTFAQGEPQSQLFDRPGLRPSLGEKMASLVVGDERAQALMLDADGGMSLIDRLIADSARNTDSRNAARALLDTLDAPGSVPRDPQARLARLNRLQFRQAKEDPRQILQELDALRTDAAGLTGEAATLQQLVNLEVTWSEAELLANRVPLPSAQDRPGLERLSADLEKQLARVLEGQQSLPENLSADPRFRGLSGQLEGARQLVLARQTQVLARLGEIRAEEEKRRLAEQLEFRGGMGYRTVRSLVSFALNSPKDSMFLAVRAEVGVSVKIPFFGEVKAFVQGRVGFDVAVEEGGQVSISFDARIGVGAGASSEALGVGAKGQVGTYSRVSYVFANEDEASKFVTSMLHQVQATDENPSYAPPTAVHHQGSFSEAELELGPIKATRRTRNNRATVTYPVPWLPRSQGQTVDISGRTEEVSLGYSSRGRQVGLSVTAEDQAGGRNQTSNGTDLTVAFEISSTATGGGTDRLLDSPSEAFIDELVESVFQMRPELLKRIPGHDRMNPEQLRKAARERILGAFTSFNVKASATARGRLELTVSCSENLMQRHNKNAMEVLFDFVANSLAAEPENNWFFKNTRVVAEFSAEAHLRLQYGAGVSVYAELGIEAGLRQADTLAGSLWHAREMLYESRPGAYFSENQLLELKKDGLITAQDTLDRPAFLVVLAKMRHELLALYEDGTWRARHAPGQTSQEFASNIDNFLQEVSRSMWAGLKNSHRTYESFEEFNRSVSIDKVRQAQDFLVDNNLTGASSDTALQRYRAGLAPAQR